MDNINLAEIEILFRLVLDKLKKDQVEKINITTDEYWIISTDEWADFKKTPQAAVGSLAEDVNYLRKAIEENEIVTYSDFDRLAAILRFISEEMAPTN